MAGAQTTTWDDGTWSHPSTQKKSKRPQILSPEGGEGNRGQMPHMCPGSPPPPPPSPALGLTLIDALACVAGGIVGARGKMPRGE